MEYGGVSDYQILQHYLQPYHNHAELKVGVNIQNPFILDPQQTPSFGIGRGVEDKNDFIYNDFATGNKGTAVNLVMEMFGLTFPQAIQKIERDFGTTKNTATKTYDKPEEKEFTFDIEFKDFSQSSLDFWNQGNIDPTKCNIHEVVSYKRHDEKAVKIVSTELDPIFAYKITDKCYKLYRPFSLDKRYKFGWIGQKPKEYIYGYDRLPEKGKIVILTAGEKDCNTAISNGYPAICLNSETTLPSADLLANINSRFDMFAFCYDLDDTGKAQGEKLIKLGLAPIELPKEMVDHKLKDLFDFVKNKELFPEYSVDSIISKTLDFNKYAIFNKAYEMVSGLDVPNSPVTLEFKGLVALKKGNICTLVAGEGIGKSQVSDAITSQILLNTDALGYSLNSDGVSRILHIDTERDPSDLQLGLNTIYRRAKINNLSPGFTDSELFNYWSFKMNMSAEENRLMLEKLLENKSKHYDFIIIDGIGDFVKSYNDEEECKLLVEWLGRFAQKSMTSIFLTIHENIGSDGRPSGHLGTFLRRKSYSMLRLQNNKEDRSIKEITNEFALGKLRGRDDPATSYFRWDNSENVNMYVSLSDNDCQTMMQDNNPKKTTKYYLEKLFPNSMVNISHNAILNILVDDYGLSVNKSENTIKEWSKLGYIVRFNNNYQLSAKSPEIISNKIPDDVVSEGFSVENEDAPF
jgi:hypothetical protein